MSPVVAIGFDEREPKEAQGREGRTNLKERANSSLRDQPRRDLRSKNDGDGGRDEHESGFHGTGESHGEKDEIDVESELGAGLSFEFRRRADADRV